MGGYEHDREDLLEDPPYLPPQSTGPSRLTLGATALGVVAGAIVTFGVLRQPANSGGTTSSPYVPVIVATGAPQGTATASATPTPSAASASASPSPRPSASAHAKRSRPSPSPSLSLPAPPAPPSSPSPAWSPPPSPVASRLPQREYEGDARANILSGGSFVGNCSVCPDLTVVRYIGKGGTLTFPNVSASVAGNYTLTVVYLEGDANGGRYATVSVNGAYADAYFPGDGNWNSVQTVTLTVRLAQGDNSIEFSNPNDYAPDIAEIVV